MDSDTPSNEEIFTSIYVNERWGRSPDPQQKFYSGIGSHGPDRVEPYVTAVGSFLSSLPKKPNVVDLGCGDFAIGSKIRPFCDRYIACDVVKPLIEWNREKYRDTNTDFRALDITKDTIPSGDIVFLRQVLMHLSNECILGVLPSIASQFTYLVLTENLPWEEPFPHNVDKITDTEIRIVQNSGVILTSPPFNLKVMENTVLCEIRELGRMRTNLYRLK